jgi:DNA-binding CsgD family transcriptional regulator
VHVYGSFRREDPAKTKSSDLTDEDLAETTGEKSSLVPRALFQATGSNMNLMVVLARQLSNTSPSPLSRALRAYRQLDLRAPSAKTRARAVPKRARYLNDAERTRLAERYRAGATIRELALEFGVAPRTASHHLKLAGVDVRSRAMSSDEVAEAIRLYAAGLSTKAVGERLGRHHSAIWNALRRAGIELRNTQGRVRS